MVIDWSVTQVYNTIMSISTGVGLLLLIRFGSHLSRRKIRQLEGWAMGFAIPGFILTLTGAHMILTWPLSKIGFPFDDIIFGEPSLAFGVMLLAAAILLWRKSNQYIRQNIDLNDSKAISELLLRELPYAIKPLSYFAAAMGLALISIACAGIGFQLFAAPPEEPISGTFANYPWVEAIFMSGLIGITGIGAILLPFMLKDSANPAIRSVVKYCWTIAGVVFILFGAMNYFTHIGLIINTMK
ncbi:hypothetical protein DRW41_11600 [Neobacillus piezotolerans]|uniref:DUF981 domain-containing protein n=1 Tax=Neobacillus piezotolerans TaxID=2259171 RepID=A0A3D8GQC9_9BACI|nr:DUF981 domain-containing protein [Neobacillus piezotolerans]RDU36694.1 hypothetical protein DRW41_11600 [Neobacillus piezotolerans]